MRKRPEFPELMPPEAPHAQRVPAPAWWLPVAAVLGAVLWAVILILLF